MTEQNDNKPNQLTVIWLVLLGLTLFSAYFAEGPELTTVGVLLICGTVMIKGSLVVDFFMGLRGTEGHIRRVMLAYMLVLGPLIAWAILCPEQLLQLTSL